MALTYILGGPGTGKSTVLMKRLIDSSLQYPNKRHIMLVPEQFTMQTQRNIIALHPRHAIMNIDILSFERLAYRVFGEMGKEDIHVLTDMGKNMLLRKASSEHADELKVFRRSLKKPGFISRLMSLLSEFYQYGVTEESLEDMINRMEDHPLLRHKLLDLQTFYHALNLHKGESSIAAEEVLPILLRLLPDSDFLDGTVIAMDNFTGFTSIQYALLKIMLAKAEDISMAFVIPKKDWKEEIRTEDLFYMSHSAVFTMNRMAKEAHVPVKVHFCETAHRYENAPDLAFLAENLMHNTALAWSSSTAIRTLSFRNPRAEADYAASRIAYMVREEGYRYRDFAVVTGDLEEYRDFLSPAFRRYDIPAFMDRKKGILGNPLVEYLRSAIAIFPEDFSFDAVFRYLKCGMPVLPVEDLNLMENYCLANGIRGQKRWREPWDRVPNPKLPPDLEKLNAARSLVWNSLEPIHRIRTKTFKSGTQGTDALPNSEPAVTATTIHSSNEPSAPVTTVHQSNEPSALVTVAHRTQALRDMMERIHADAVMEEMSVTMEKMGQLELTQEYHMVYDYLLELLKQMDELLGSSVLTLQEFADILDAGLSEAKLGKIPPSLDRVQVGDVMRSRLTDIKVLIVLGFNDGIIPGVHATGGILSESERALLEENQMNLAPTAEVVSNQDRFYLYTLLTKPSHRLYLTSSRMGMDGNARRVSYLFRNIQKLFPDLAMEEGDEEASRIEYICEQRLWEITAQNLAPMKKSALQGEEHEGLALAHCLYGENPGKMQQMIQANFALYEGSSLTRAGASALYGKELTGSVTRLETYAKCAYAHFLNFGLQLTEREDGQIHSDKRGNFFHKTLEVFFRMLREREISYRELPEEEMRRLVEDAVIQASESQGIVMMEENGRNHYLKRRWAQMADHTVETILRFLKTEDFIPEAFELRFDGYNTPAMRMRFSQEEQMVLRGTVDRLDNYQSEDSDRMYLRVVDYKTGKNQLDAALLYDGIQMQLPMYLEAVMDRAERVYPEKKVLPGGIYYYLVEDPCVEVTDDLEEEDILRLRDKELQMKGMTLNLDEVKEHMGDVKGSKVTVDQFQALRSHVRKKALQYAGEIMEGNISVLPYQQKKSTGCDYCSYRGVCGFRPQKEGYRYRRLKNLNEKDLWSLLEEEDKDAMDNGSTENH